MEQRCITRIQLERSCLGLVVQKSGMQANIYYSHVCNIVVSTTHIGWDVHIIII